MAYYRHVAMRAKFAKLGIQAGKATITFEVGGEELYNLPTLALLTGEKVRIDVESDQSVLLVDGRTGEIGGGGDALIADENSEEVEGDVEEPSNDTEADELPPAAQAYDDELAGIFGADAA